VSTTAAPPLQTPRYVPPLLWAARPRPRCPTGTHMRRRDTCSLGFPCVVRQPCGFPTQARPASINGVPSFTQVQGVARNVTGAVTASQAAMSTQDEGEMNGRERKRLCVALDPLPMDRCGECV